MPLEPASWLAGLDLGEDLEQVAAGIREAVRSEDRLVATVCAEQLQHGGKRLRPTLLLLAARLGGQAARGVTQLAVALELLHTGTLYHDDVVDEAATRRFRPSVNARWGNAMAVFSGGYLLSRAMHLFAGGGDEINRLVSRAVDRVCRGQTRELQHVRDLDLGEARYFEIIEDKTATLYELACRIGGLVGGLSPSRVDLLARYGADVGTGFQLIDDVLDLVGDEATLGKPRAADLRGGVYTLPVLHTMARQDADARRLRAILAEGELSAPRILEALDILLRNRSIEYAISRARAALDRAVDHLAGLPERPARQALSRLPAHVLARASHCRPTVQAAALPK